MKYIVVEPSLIKLYRIQSPLVRLQQPHKHLILSESDLKHCQAEVRIHAPWRISVKLICFCLRRLRIAKKNPCVNERVFWFLSQVKK